MARQCQAKFIGFPINPSKQASEKSCIARHSSILRACSNSPSKIMEDFDGYFNCKWKLWQKLYQTSDTELWGIRSQINKNKLSIAKIYKNINNKKQLKQIMEQYVCITNNCLLVCNGIFYSKKKSSVIIVMERLHSNLTKMLVNNKNSINMNQYYYKKREMFIKPIVGEILDKIWILHNNNYVHTQIEPSHIMLRDCSKWENEANKLHNIIKNGWKLIGFSHIIANNNKLNGIISNKMIGWSAPELDVTKKGNKITFAADIWSFGLIILSLLGFQPFLLSEREATILLSTDKNDNKLKYKIRKQWYLNKILGNGGQLFLTRFLETLYSKKIISMELFTLLCGILIYNPSSRWNCKQIYNSMWLNHIIVPKKHKKYNNNNNNNNDNNNNNNNL